ncbi:MAG: NAD-dependent epimerase/dehydratase family protein, partial [Proteobacteria bacterium]|nr:NAD-dependent epimerase/dehydratase family protein [Pseudomonadota bacterium]
MNTCDALFESMIPGLPLIGRGKVRDIYSVDDGHLLIVTTDRLSAYDVVLPDPIPMKGCVLTDISLRWFRMMADLVENQLTDRSVDDVVDNAELIPSLRGRSLVVKRLKPLPIEAVVRGYLIGSGWRDYQESGQVCGIKLPPDLSQAEQLPQTLFTPASKAAAEGLIIAAMRTYNVKACVSRCTNNYGPHQDDEKFIPTIIRHALEDEPIPVYAEGKNKRDWLYVTDHCDALETILAT